jgi:tRNA dimethylallyltransferase
VKLPEPFENVLVLTGPTASGKTALALELATRLNAEIIAMDSMTLYRGMDIGTAKPAPAERSAVPHHLLDVLNPWESGNVAWWLREAARCCREIEGRGKQVLFVGGTPFYLKALLQGLFDSPPSDPGLRRQLEEEAAVAGPVELHARLAALDPASAERLHANDVRRVVRALEIWHLTGKPLSAWQQQGWWGHNQAPANDSSGFPHCLALDVPREELYARIDQRVVRMLEAGWLDEVRALRNLPQPWAKEPSQALGYRELAEYLDGKGALPSATAAIQMRSRQFAKRQLTWFRHMPGCRLVQGKLTFDLWCRKMS